MVPISVADGSEGIAMSSTETEERKKEFAMIKKQKQKQTKKPERPISLFRSVNNYGYN